MKKFIAAVVLLITSVCYADAPLGLKWGESVNELKDKGITFYTKSPIEEKIFTVWNVKNVPIEMPGASGYVFLTHKTQGLQKVVVLMDINKDDPYGTESKSDYAKVKESLIAKYGDPQDTIEGIKFYTTDVPGFFYLCLKDKHCGAFMTFFELNKTNILLQIIPINSQSGYVEIMYESQTYEGLKKEADAELHDAKIKAL
jgi:hypothetical protein